MKTPKPDLPRGTKAQPLKVAIQQPALPAYRVSVFATLNQFNDIEIVLSYGNQVDLENVTSKGFPAEHYETTRIELPYFGELFLDKIHWQLAGQKKWDVIVYSWNTRYLTLIPSLIRAKCNGTPTVLWGHGYSKSPSFLRNFLRNSLIKLATATLFYDPISKKQIEGEEPKKNFFTAPNALDQTQIRKASDFWRNDKEALNSFQSENAIADRPLILFVSRLHSHNRLDLLFEAIAELKASFPKILLTIIGNGSASTFETLNRQIAELDIGPNVLFTGPIYHERNLAPWFLSATVFCYPSNVGLSLMHAFGYKLPVIIGDDFSKCNPEIYAFRTGENGLTFSDGDSLDLANQIRLLIENPNYQKILGEGAYQTILEKANIDIMVAGFRDAIKYAASSKN